MECDLNEARKRTFRNICQNFYSKFVKQIAKRCDFTDPVIKMAALSNLKSFVKLENLNDLLRQFPEFVTVTDLKRLSNEFCTLEKSFLTGRFIDTNDLTWSEVSNTTIRGMVISSFRYRSFVRIFQ